MYMDYNEENTLWIPLGTMDNVDIDDIMDASRDSQIFLESKAKFTDALNNLPHLTSFGTYRPDPCQPVPFEKLKPWEEDGNIASFVTGTTKNNEGLSD
jgi:hypothetical protein